MRSTFKTILISTMIVTAMAGAFSLVTGCGRGKPSGQTLEKKTIYTCPMHPQIRRDKPGDCPICGMKLVPVPQENSSKSGDAPGVKAGQSGERKVKYWTDAMNPGFKSDKPGKAPDGMDLVPVYEEETVSGNEMEPEALKGLAPVYLSAYKQQLIGVRVASVVKAPVTRIIRTNGRFAGGSGDFAALAGDFAAQRTLRASGRYVVADVYALDMPFVREGQKAFVTALSGSGARITGKVTHVYPFDETQSRVTRVRIDLAQAAPRELFANVDIEAVTAPILAVPTTAVMDTGTHRYVFLETEPGTFTPREITVGYQGADSWEVVSGLKEGDRVVDGANFLIDADSKLKAAFAQEK